MFCQSGPAGDAMSLLENEEQLIDYFLDYGWAPDQWKVFDDDKGFWAGLKFLAWTWPDGSTTDESSYLFDTPYGPIPGAVNIPLEKCTTTSLYGTP